MASEIPQLKDEQPILNTVNINSTADSHEAFAKTLGALAQSSTEEVKELVGEQSKSMYVNSVANAEQVKNSAQKLMIEHPDRAAKIAKDTDVTLDSIRNNAFVNKEDRQKLNGFLSSTSQEVGLEAVKTNMHQTQLEAAYTHFANFPDQLKVYNNLLLTDPDKAEQYHKDLIASLHNLVSIGAITPVQAGKSIKTMSEVVGNAQSYHDLLTNVNGSAEDYHTVTSSPLNGGEHKANAPINEDTRWLVDHHNSDLSFKGVQADIANRKLPSGEAWTKLTPTHQQQAMEEIHGVQVADGMINSGRSFPDIEHTYKSLSEKGEVLSYKDSATKNALGLYINDMKNGNYLTVIGRTPVGNAINEDYLKRNSAIANAPIDQSQKNQLLTQNKNNMVNRSIAYGQAHHIPAEYIQPIPQADVTAVQNSFVAGQDPTTALTIMRTYNKQNQLYLASAMKDPKQRVVLSTVSLGGTNNTDQENIDYIAANQNRKYTELDTTTDERVSDDYLRNQVNTNITNAIKLNIAQQDPVVATAMNEQLILSGINYAKYISEKNGQYSLKKEASYNSVDNVSQVARYINKSYDVMSGDNYLVNKNQVNIDKPKMDVLAQYAITQGNAYLRSHVSESTHVALMDRAPLMVTVTAKGNLVAKTNDGLIAYSQPLTTELISHALIEHKKAQQIQNERQVKVFHPLMNKVNV